MPNLCIFPARALNDPSLTPTDIKVLAAIGTHTDRDGSGCWANSKTLAEEAGVSSSTFFASTARLIASSLIERTSGQLQGRSSDYRVMLDAPRVSRISDTQVSGQPDTPPPAPRTPVSAQPDTTTINDPINDPLNESSPGIIDPALPFLVKGYGADWDELQGRINQSRGSTHAWRAELTAALDGMHSKPATPLQISNAIRHFIASGAEISLRLFMGYLRSSIAGPAENGSGVTPAGQNGRSTRFRSAGKTLEAAELKDRLLAVSAIVPGQSNRSLPVGWADSFTAGEVRVIKAIGPGRILNDENHGTLISQLAKALEEV